MRDLLAPLIGARPPLLCELLEIPDERWQDAVEAMRAPAASRSSRPAKHFDVALRILEEARAREQLYEARTASIWKGSATKRVSAPSLAALSRNAEADARIYRFDPR